MRPKTRGRVTTLEESMEYEKAKRTIEKRQILEQGNEYLAFSLKQRMYIQVTQVRRCLGE